MKQYLYCNQATSSKILHRWIDAKGIERSELANFCPTLYTKSNTPTGYTGILGEMLQPKHYDSIWDAREHCKQYQDVGGFSIFGNQNWWAQFLQEEYTGEINWNPNVIRTVGLDIEVLMDKGFPHPNQAKSTITSIACGLFNDNGIIDVFALKEYQGEDESIRFHYCADERELLMKFLRYWLGVNPHVVTGWNIKGFDIPYLVNRTRRVLGEEFVKMLASTAIKIKGIKNHIIEREYQGNLEYEIMGLTILDYMHLYKKFTFKMREKYSLDFIAHVELKEQKVDYSEYGNLDELWKQNPTQYIDYNAHDVRLIQRLEKKMNLLMLVFTLSYMCHIRFDDTLSQVRMWDTLIYNKMLEKKVVIPAKESHDKSQKYEGAWVRDPEIGLHEWVVSFDLNSLYPHLIMQYNISPEMIVDVSKIENPLNFDVDDLVNGTADLEFLRDINLSMTANKAFFKRDKTGFLPEMMEMLYAQRTVAKKNQIAAEQDVEAIKKILRERGEEIND